ncbi:MAG: nucleotidyltransferase domain-containing protein [Bacteroidales bacterium]
MRLTSHQQKIITRFVHRHYGENAQVFLFGSRTNDRKRGGDIDLLLEGIRDEDNTAMRKASLIADLKRELGDQRIDLVVKTAENQRAPFIRMVDDEKIRL